MLLYSKILDVPHGFSTRLGGASQGPYSSLNLSRTVGDDESAVEENVRRFARGSGLKRPIITARQIHGSHVINPGSSSSTEAMPTPTEDADALASQDRDIAVAVKTADCVPILVHAPDVGAVAAVHAGWRGTRSRIAAVVVQTLSRDFGADPAKIRAAIGPRIGFCCFEVGVEVAAEFQAEFPPEVVARRGDRAFVDLGLANRSVLASAGVPDSQIDDLRRCTRCEGELFFSHRRDQGKTGRHVSFIALP
jgi:YfiH family protein